MDLIKKVFTLIHLVSWLLAFVFFNWVFWSEGHADWLYLAAVFIGISAAVFYSHFSILTYFLNRKRYGYYALGLFCILLLGPLPFMEAYGGSISGWPAFLDQYFTTLFSFVLICLVLSWMARASENWFINTLKRERLEKQAAQTELTYLKSQINPHFLFNTLNNIHTLVYKKSDAAPEAIRRLSSLMRYMLYESNADTVPLTREIDYLQDYINLQQLRYRQSPVVDLEIVGEVDSCHIAPLLFIHFLENAYKHSPSRLEAGAIGLSIQLKENSLIFRINNPVDTKKHKTIEEPGGIGLPNIKKRLQLLYPTQHTLQVTSSEESFEAVLTIHHLRLQKDERKTDMLYSG